MKYLLRKLGIISLLIISISACDESEISPASKDPETIARQIVATFLSIPPEDVSLVSTEQRNFNDSSLDCPTAGMAYQQVITPGHQIIVEAEGRRFDVRVSGEYGKICLNKKGSAQENNQRNKPGNSKNLINLQALPDIGEPETSGPDTSELVDRARRDLAAKLNIDTKTISSTGIKPYNKRSPLPGCLPKCPDTGTCGYVLTLNNDGRVYVYYASNQSVQACPPVVPL
ncbi:MAG: hypothetical protein OEU86_08775 [Gammaproteobacteria bacterium]|nr:hypothetical protein [Gammaproteobacteria bacterium]